MGELLISRRDMRRLNVARTTLAEIAKRAQSASWDVTARESFSRGKLHEIAENAEHEVFQVLNTAHSYCGVEIDDDLLHNRKTEAVEA